MVEKPTTWKARSRLLGWRIAGAIPWRWWVLPAWIIAVALSWWPNAAVRQWTSNFEVFAARRATRNDIRRGLMSWARATVTSLQLHRLRPEVLLSATVFSDEDSTRLRMVAASPGAVIGLPHQGSWDQCGAWACVHDMPVSTVAEELPGGEWEYFSGLRQRLGFEVYSHRDPRALPALLADARAGRLVCLLADRDFSRHGIPVIWHTPTGERRATMPPGPALVAERTGAVLLGIASHWKDGRLEVIVSPPLTAEPGTTAPQQRIAEMTQALCDFFCEQVSAHPHDWHMLQPFFEGV